MQNHFYLHRRAEWQLRHAECGARVPACAAKHVEDELRGAMHDQVLVGKIRIGVHIAGKANDVRDAV